jgi:D-inositol-3-phosphate glycosyltransferase
MHIIIVGPAYPYRGGLAAYSERLAREYISQGHQVEILPLPCNIRHSSFPEKHSFHRSQLPAI